MQTHEKEIEGRKFWFTVERPYRTNEETGELVPAGGYYCAFSTREPGALIQGEIVKDDRGRARLFSTAQAALEAGIKEVQARLSYPAEAFAVGLPGGTKDAEFQAYVDLLRAKGIDPQKRVEDSYGRKWLHVWDNRKDAESFAARLRKETRNPYWEVYDLSPPASDRRHTVEILVGRQGDGYTFSLHPASLKLLRQSFPHVTAQPTVYIGRDSLTAIQQATGLNAYDQVFTLLAGVSPDKLPVNTFAGYRIVDPVSDLTLWEAA